MGIQVKQTSFELIPTGEYPAVIKGVEQVTGQFGEQLKVSFELTSPDMAGKAFTSWVSMTFNPKSRLYELTKAAFGGAAIPEDWDFDSDTILNRKLVLVIVEKASKGDPNKHVNSVQLYKAAPKAKPAAVQPAKPGAKAVTPALPVVETDPPAEETPF